MGQRRRQVREELERRESEVANGSSSSGLGAGGEARVAAAKLDELRKQGDAKRQKQSRERSAAWDSACASAKKRGASPGSSSERGKGDDDLEERTVRVKWSTKKESHSDHTLDMLFSRFGAVESVSIEEGTGNRALVTFVLATSADAAVTTYRDGETMRANYVGKRRPKRSAFAPRRHTASPAMMRQSFKRWNENGGGGGEGESPTVNSFRDRESLIMMKLRQEAERQALIRKMAEEEDPAVAGERDAGRRGGTVARSSDISSGAGSSAATASTGDASADALTEPADASREGGGAGGVDSGIDVEPATMMWRTGTPAAASDRSDSSQSVVDSEGGMNRPAFPVPSPMARSGGAMRASRRSGSPPATMAGFVAGRSGLFAGVDSGSRSVPATPVSAKSSVGKALDESDILARMMAMKR